MNFADRSLSIFLCAKDLYITPWICRVSRCRWHCTSISEYIFCWQVSHSFISTKVIFYTEYFAFSIAWQRSKRVNNDVMHAFCRCEQRIVVFGGTRKKIIIWYFMFDMLYIHVCNVCRWLCDFREMLLSTWLVNIGILERAALNSSHLWSMARVVFKKGQKVSHTIFSLVLQGKFWIWWFSFTSFLKKKWAHFQPFFCRSSFNHQWQFSLVFGYTTQKLISRVSFVSVKSFMKWKIACVKWILGHPFFTATTAAATVAATVVAADKCGEKYDRIMCEKVALWNLISMVFSGYVSKKCSRDMD